MRDPFAERAKHRLKPVQVAGFARPVDLVGRHLTIGRAEDCDLRLPADDFPSVSSHHARVEELDGELWVEDLGSTNGTLVNGERVERAKLSVGDLLQLGSIGPRFVVVSSAPLSRTVYVDPKALGVPRKGDELSEARVQELVQRRAKSIGLQLAVLGVLVVAALVLWGLNLSRRGRDRLEEAQTAHRFEIEEARAIIADLQARDRESEARLAAVEHGRSSYVAGLEATIAAYEREAEELNGRLAALEQEGAAGPEITRLEASLARTQQELTSARAEIELFDPVNLEQARLSGVSRVRESIVLLEVEITFEDRDTHKLLHLSADGEPNFDDAGDPWSLASTGSGFCVSPEGWILTNAHVVRPSANHEFLAATLGMPVEPRVRVRAVFSGQSRRHPVSIVKVAGGEVDLALLKIRPFDYMPHLRDFDVDVEPPEPGSDLYLFGFPLGNFALQEGPTVIASTFRGILSRMVGGQMQVDAGVHPGNSGGPITDVQGRVIGIVFSVQALPDQTAVYTIGYGIPIASARDVWPPPGEWEEPPFDEQ